MNPGNLSSDRKHQPACVRSVHESRYVVLVFKDQSLSADIDFLFSVQKKTEYGPGQKCVKASVLLKLGQSLSLKERHSRCLLRMEL